MSSRAPPASLGSFLRQGLFIAAGLAGTSEQSASPGDFLAHQRVTLGAAFFSWLIPHRKVAVGVFAAAPEHLALAACALDKGAFAPLTRAGDTSDFLLFGLLQDVLALGII